MHKSRCMSVFDPTLQSFSTSVSIKSSGNLSSAWRGRSVLQELNLQARLAAIEYMLANLYRLVHGVAGSTPEQIQSNHEQARETLRRVTIPGADPAQSDEFVAEVQAAVENILIQIEVMAGMHEL
jgi:hypothetical protein